MYTLYKGTFTNQITKQPSVYYYYTQSNLIWIVTNPEAQAKEEILGALHHSTAYTAEHYIEVMESLDDREHEYLDTLTSLREVAQTINFYEALMS